MYNYKKISHLTKVKLPFVAGLVLAVFGLLTISGLAVQKVHADRPEDCDSNAIIYCGFSSASSFISKVKNNDSNNGHHDLVAIYKHFGLESSDYDRFVKYSETGTAYKDGRIVVDGQTVATNGRSLGREKSAHSGSGMFTETVGDETLYGNSTSRTFGSNSIPVTVLFNSKGQVEFAVLQSCGNPELVTPITPTYSCNSLSATAVSGKTNTYSFTSSASAGNNASIAKLVYTFGDGSTAVTTTNPATPVTHTYTGPGSFTARVTVYVNLPGNQQVTVTNGGCTKVITIPQPFYACLALDGSILNKATNTYSYKVTGKYANGATPTGATISFGDGSRKDVTMSSTTATTTHSYSKAGVYTAKAVIYFTAYGKSYKTLVGNCTASISVIVPYYQCLQLTGATIDATKYSYTFTATAKYGNGAKLVSADFTYGDGTTAKGVKPTTSTTFTVSHTFSTAGQYDVVALLHFTANDKTVSAPTCAALVTPTAPPTPECKPGVPVGSAECSPCQYDSSLSSDSTECVAPATTELPNTGAGNTIAIFAAVVIGGFLVYRQLLFRQHKAAFAAAQNGTSPLPLGDPMSDAPLAGTPLAPTKRRSLRRKRQF